MYKIGIISNSNYSQKQKVRDVFKGIYGYTGKHGTLASGGTDAGPEYWAKKFAIEYGMKYKEFNPSYTGFNMYSAMEEDYYGKNFHISQIFDRYKRLVNYCDKIIVFKEYGVDVTDDVNYAIKWAQKTSKKIGIIT